MTNAASGPDVQIILVSFPDGTLREKSDKDTDIRWCRTQYTNGACPDGSDCWKDSCELGHSICYVCTRDILDEWFFTCLDDGSVNVHTSCITVETACCRSCHSAIDNRCKLDNQCVCHLPDVSPGHDAF